MDGMPAATEHPRLVAGRYRLRSVLGSGSMGTVWSAYDEFLHRPVAVKEVRLPPGMPPAQTAELRERALREARAIAVLSHPNVVILYDVAREHGRPFVVMELLPSRSLAELLRERGALTTEQAVAVASAVAGGLEAAHAAGITHRDVKPGNVLVAADGRIKLTDFGIARNVAEATMTRTGMMLGSPAFIAPEVASGGQVTSAADLWGLGATLFAAVEGRPPYDADGDPVETVSRVVHDEVPRPAPGPLAPVIRGLMTKDPAQRMSLAEVRRRLYELPVRPRHNSFGPDLLAGSETTITERVGEPATDVLPAPPLPAASSSASAQLAADPGPLPFGAGVRSSTTWHAAPARRRGRSFPLVVVTALLLFLLAAGGTFAATRALAGRPLLPPQQAEQAGPVSPAPAPLETRGGDVSGPQADAAGRFRVRVPGDWVRFVSRQPATNSDTPLPASTLVEFVSPDGAQVLTVERFADFFAGADLVDYRAALSAEWPRGDFALVESGPLPEGDGVRMHYRTVDRAWSPDARDAGSRLNRSTFADAFRHGGDLWVVRVTVPTEQEGTGRTQLFDRLVPTFEITG
jgi:serine/threonine protein kinase